MNHHYYLVRERLALNFTLTSSSLPSFRLNLQFEKVSTAPGPAGSSPQKFKFCSQQSTPQLKEAETLLERCRTLRCTILNLEHERRKEGDHEDSSHT